MSTSLFVAAEVASVVSSWTRAMATEIAVRPRYWRTWASWVIYASLQHIVWGVLLILDESAGRATAVHSVDILQVPQLTGLGMMVAAVLGIVSLYVDRHGSSITGLILSLPQQGLLVMAAWGSGAAILRSSYADGVERPQAFICADQSPVLIVLLMHTIAMIMFHHQRGTR